VEQEPGDRECQDQGRDRDRRAPAGGGPSEQDRELAHEDPRGRQTGEHQRGDDERPAVRRRAGEASGQPADPAAAALRDDLARREEGRRLREPVTGEVEGEAQEREVAAEPEGQGGEAEMLDRGVGQEPLEVTLGDDEWERHDQAQEPEDDQQGR